MSAIKIAADVAHPVTLEPATPTAADAVAEQRLVELHKRVALIGGTLDVRLELDGRITYIVRHHPPHNSIQHHEFENLDTLEAWISRKPVRGVAS